MQVHRFYLPASECREDVLRLAGQEARHALRVLRLQPGDTAMVLDGKGNEFHCEVESASRDSLSLRVKQRHTAPALPCSITLLVGIPKGKIIESIIQKSAELGARAIVPLLADRAVTRLDDKDARHKRDQWQQTAIEAMKQCGAPRLPEIETPASVSDFLARKKSFELQLVGSLQKQRRHPSEVFREFEKVNGRPPQNAAVWIGPEGDFTPDELKMIEHSGARPVSFGHLVLRVETAAIYCLSILNYEFNSSALPDTLDPG
ncbi:MAG TPA: RsmE family RNA methyltransferase [Verrucomicrobiae bacterium]|jgi:16S rRNA (uracil1498-N3)-methyltransferase|nr:RsmE family RNA methyltransferase [Verrucomicrobiae bacterium]